MNRRLFLTTVAAATAAPLGAAQRESARPSRRKPNIVLFLVDDMGRDWIGCYGAAQSTPHVDAFAALGVRFETAYSMPSCTPTRVELLTGRYPFRTGWVDHYDVPRWGGKGLDWERETTFTRLLRDAGYATGITGKWQINDFRAYPDALKRHGFDEDCMWTGVENGNPASAQRYADPFLQINGERKTHRGKYGPDIVNDFARDFVRRHRDRPFLLYYPSILVHGPGEPTPDNRANPLRDEKGLFAGMLSYMDKLFGTFIKEVDGLGLADNTFIVFAADNGSPIPGSLNGVPFPPGKGRLTDLGVHVPFIVRAPWLTTSARVSTDLIDFSDVFPTLCELAGVTVPAGLRLDGRSFVGSLTGRAKNKRAWIYAQRGTSRMVREHRYKLDSDGSLFDLSVDPFEDTDLRTSRDADVVAARTRLSAVLNGLPADGPVPFEGYKPRRGTGG
ncbi:MAG TPA: sulfatase-like hydrolase/transferase [Acidobacteriota bacterium]|jgi:arylsulfatase A-like enzyme